MLIWMVHCPEWVWRLKSPASRLFIQMFIQRRSRKTSKLLVTGLCEGNSPGTGEFPAQGASNAENVSIWWRHHDVPDWSVKLNLVILQNTEYAQRGLSDTQVKGHHQTHSIEEKKITHWFKLHWNLFLSGDPNDNMLALDHMGKIAWSDQGCKFRQIRIVYRTLENSQPFIHLNIKDCFRT